MANRKPLSCPADAGIIRFDDDMDDCRSEDQKKIDALQDKLDKINTIVRTRFELHDAGMAVTPSEIISNSALNRIWEVLHGKGVWSTTPT